MIKSSIFYFLLVLWTIFLGILFIPFLFLPKDKLYKPAQIWIGGIFQLLDKICNLSFEIKGQEHMDNKIKLIASKHQSTFETLLLFYKLPKSIFIHKRELFLIPIFGLYLKKLNMISINRSAGPRALKKMLSDSVDRISRGNILIIFPEGTRKKPGENPDYKPGIAGIYNVLNSDVLPVALNSGLFWPKNSLVIRPGKITLEFLPPIKKGLEKESFLETLQKTIEDKTISLTF